jgi:hypothetical protein
MIISAYLIPALEKKRDVRKPRDLVKAEKIIDYVCEFFGVSKIALLRRNGRAGIVYARYWAVWFIIRETKLSLREIGILFGKKANNAHCFAIYARDSILEQLNLSISNYYKEDYESLCDILESGCIPKDMGRPTSRVKQRKKILRVVEPEEVYVPVVRHKPVYTNTNWEQQLEERVKALAI